MREDDNLASFENKTIKANICFAGCARNVAPFLPRHLKKMRKIGERLENWHYIFLENNSNDETDEILDNFHAKHTRGIIKHFGDMDKNIPKRTERLAFLRNETISILLEDEKLSKCDFLVIMDLDKVNLDLDIEVFLKIIKIANPEWAAIFANQLPFYYDIWALRHNEWSPDDCWKQVRERPFYMSKKRAKEKFINSRQRFVDPSSPLIEVESAFGGLGIYNMEYIKLVGNDAYKGLDKKGHEICEHVSFHEAIRNVGGKLFIDPSLINLRSTM